MPLNTYSNTLFHGGNSLSSEKLAKPMKPRLDFAIRRIELQVQKLEQAIERFCQRDKTIFARVVDAQTKHDSGRAKVFGSELTEIRKMEKLIINSKLALDQALLKLRAISTPNDVVPNLGVTLGILRPVKATVASIFPDVEMEVGEISNMLSGIMIETAQDSMMTLNFGTINKDTSAILIEAMKLAEQTCKDKLPEFSA
jgi:division protein CdvB (Snf7/Vps24/ESCRT-III family)